MRPHDKLKEKVSDQQGAPFGETKREVVMNSVKGFGKGLGFIAIAILVLAGLFALGTSSTSAGPQKGNETKGKFYFKQTCKSCHVKGEKGGEVTPLSKTQAQWQLYFEKGKHAKGAEPLSKYLSPEQLRDVQAFLFNHAVDSPQPETCGK
jgi:mono/diheme cytochrome c family protein